MRHFLSFVLLVTALSSGTWAAAPTLASTEAALLAILRSDAPEADKALACKFLAINGSSAAVADLAPLLSNPRLASWARIALEAIPGDEASTALRDAAAKLDGLLLCGVLTSLGVRNDSAAVPILAAKMGGKDAEVAACAAWSLGQIATPEAAALLSGAVAGARDPNHMNSAAKAAVLCGENLVKAGKVEDALALYGIVLAECGNEQRHAEATRGIIIAKGKDGIPLLVESLRSPSKRLSNMAIFTARDLGRGDKPDASLAAAVDAAILAEIKKVVVDGALARAEVLIDVIAERNVGAASESVVTALAALAGPDSAKPLRLAAIEALGRSGSARVIGPLLDAAADSDSGVADTALEAVATLEGEVVNREIAERLAGANASLLPALLELVGRRRIDAVAAVLPLVNHRDEKVRTAALIALGPTVDLGNLDVLVLAATLPQSEAEGSIARTSLQEASVRMADREACATKLAAAFEKASADAKVMLLEVMGEVGGTKAVQTMAAAARSGDVALEDAATRLLGKWMTKDAAPILHELATAEPGGKFKTRALKGYLRIARQFILPDAERAEMCRRALAASKADADRKVVLEILDRYPSAATLAVAEEAEKVEGLEAEAKKTAKSIRDKLAAQKKAG